jgi:hypothetical protein
MFGLTSIDGAEAAKAKKKKKDAREAILAKFDTNRNGKLDRLEKAAARQAGALKRNEKVVKGIK